MLKALHAGLLLACILQHLAQAVVGQVSDLPVSGVSDSTSGSALRDRARSGEAELDDSAASGRDGRFAVKLTVTGLPSQASHAPVSVEIDFDALLASKGIRGPVDERSIRLTAVGPSGARRQEPVQFSAAPQPRLPDRPLLPETVPGVSYLGDYRPREAPAAIRLAGTLTWLAKSNAEYELEFASFQKGRAVQVPYSPQTLRMFDDHERATPVRWYPVMQIRPQWPMEGKLHVFEQNQLLTTYHLGPMHSVVPPSGYRRPFFYPFIGPDGVSLTEFGKPHDPTGSHAHHYSLWVAHASVDSLDFWSERGGLVAHDHLESLDDGPVFCRVVQHTRWIHGGKALVRDRREYKFYKTTSNHRLIDLELEFSPAGPEPVTFGRTSFGFLAIRVAQSMSVFDGGGEILNSRGQRNEQQAHLQRAEWIDQAGPIAPERWNGIAIFDHPANFNHPTAWHCRNDGWVGAAFNSSAAYTLQPGESLRLRYRLHLHRGNAADGAVAERYSEYASGPVVRTGPLREK